MGTAHKFEDILFMVGDTGRWQYMVFLFTWIEGILIGFHHLSSVFLGYSPKHWCSMEGITFPNGTTLEEKMNYTIPRDEEGEYESCKMYNVTGNQMKSDGILECNQFEYATDMGWTTVSEWDLVCDRIALLSTVQGSYMGGVFVGCIFWGWCSDKFGRRPSILIASAIQIVSSIIAAFSVNYMMFIFFRFLIAFSVSGVFECGFVLVTEIVSPKLRTPFGVLTQFPFGMGAALLPLVAYFVKDWQPLQLAISVPCILLISYYWLIPESPRWLISKGRVKEAFQVLKKAAKVNRKQLPTDSEFMEMLQSIEVADENENVEEQESVLGKITDAFKEIVMLVKTPEMRKRTLTTYFTWFVVAMVYYGLSFNTKNIGADIYVSNFLSGFVEIVATVVIIPALARFGRMKIYSGTFIAGGICCISVAVILFATSNSSLIPLIVTLAMIGKFLIAGTFALAYLYVAELFPTPVRNVALGGASTFARVGSMMAPFIVDILGNISAGIPALIFGIFSVLAGLVSIMLPETLNKKLPETVEDVEAYGTKSIVNGEMKDVTT